MPQSSSAESNKVRPRFGNRYLTDEEDVFAHNAWDDVEWTEVQEVAAREQVAANSTINFTPRELEDLEKNANGHWDSFYEIHQNRFFKDRHWLFTEFPELAATQNTVVFEIGCGVGNTVFPLMQNSKDRELFVYCCDFSEKAIDILKNNEMYDAERCSAFVFDATTDDWNLPMDDSSIDIVVLIFVLSAIRPDKLAGIAPKIYRLLKPGGVLLFRDYGRHDLAQLRFKPGRCIGNNFYLRGDKTRVYFFTQDDVRRLFVGAGFVEEENKVDRRLQINRARLLRMYRVWIQAKYRKPIAS